MLATLDAYNTRCSQHSMLITLDAHYRGIFVLPYPHAPYNNFILASPFTYRLISITAKQI